MNRGYINNLIDLFLLKAECVNSCELVRSIRQHPSEFKQIMASFPPPTSTISTSIQSYNADEWEQKRLVITQLYRDEAKTLRIVQAILAQQYGFRPT
jgi:hypothetical protein